MRDVWDLDDSTHFLNHGSFGATPRVVLEHQRALRERLEANPVRFLKRDYEPLLDAARAAAARFIGAHPDDIAFVSNATSGVNTVLRSLTFEPGDELLTTSHAYNACKNVMEFVAARFGAKVVIAEIPFPVASAAVLSEGVLARVTPKTKVVLIDQITSPTAIVFPVDVLVRQLESRGIAVLVDAAHGPGQVPLHLAQTGASFTTGNFHKWACTPKGSAFLHVRKDWQDRIRPLTISHGANATRTDRSRFRLEFDWVGTVDPTPWLATPKALEVMGSLLPGGWDELMSRNHADVIGYRAQLLEVLRIPAPCPDDMLAAMATVPLPNLPSGWDRMLQDELKVEVPLIWFGGRPHTRVSAQRYVRSTDVAALVRALAQL